MTRRHDETRLREEIDDHVAFETDANLRRGLPPAEARRRALLTFGSMETFKENYRDQQGVPALEHLLQDVRDRASEDVEDARLHGRGDRHAGAWPWTDERRHEPGLRALPEAAAGGRRGAGRVR